MLALQEKSAGIASVGVYFVPEDEAFTIATPDGPALVTGAVVTADLPQVLGVRPMLGASFSSTPDAREALIGETLWHESLRWIARCDRPEYSAERTRPLRSSA